MARPKLSLVQVLEILRQRQRDEFGCRQRRTLAAIANDFDVSPETVRLIEQRRIWKKLLQTEGVCRGA